MASFKITGIIYKVDAPTTRQVNEKTYTSRLFTLFVRNEKNEAFSDYLQFELFGQNCNIIDAYKVGQVVEVLFDLRGRKFQKKDGSGEAVFNSLSAYAVLDPANPQQSYAGAPTTPQPQQTVIQGAKPQQAGYAQVMPDGPTGDLPF